MNIISHSYFFSFFTPLHPSSLPLIPPNHSPLILFYFKLFHKLRKIKDPCNLIPTSRSAKKCYVLYCTLFWRHAGGAENLILALHLGINLGSTQGFQVNNMPEKVLYKLYSLPIFSLYHTLPPYVKFIVKALHLLKELHWSDKK